MVLLHIRNPPLKCEDFMNSRLIYQISPRYDAPTITPGRTALLHKCWFLLFKQIRSYSMPGEPRTSMRLVL
jgi:hypothetical protein